MQAHTGALTANWPHLHTKETLTTFLPAYLSMMEVIEKVSFMLECLEATCFYSGRNIKTRSLRKISRTGTKCHNGFTKCPSWKGIREELKRCFSDQTSLGHAAAQLRKYDSRA